MLNLSGLDILIVEDEYFIAFDLARALTEAGARVVGPVGSVKDAIDRIRQCKSLSAAVLDINLVEEKVFAVADKLVERGIPFVFSTGYDADVIPERHRGVIRIEKPADPQSIMRVLLSMDAA